LRSEIRVAKDVTPGGEIRNPKDVGDTYEECAYR